jgi:hypothetical protein
MGVGDHPHQTTFTKGPNTMSEHNYAGLQFKHNLEKHPEVFIIDDNTIKQVEETTKQIRAKQDAEAPAPDKLDLRKEYNRLRQQLFDIQQNAKCYEIRTNEAAGQVHLIEQRITEALKNKKAAIEAHNLRGERMYEWQVTSLETELADAQVELSKNRRWSIEAGRALKNFPSHDRIAELKAMLEQHKR